MFGEDKWSELYLSAILQHPTDYLLVPKLANPHSDYCPIEGAPIGLETSSQSFFFWLAFSLCPALFTPSKS